MGKPYSGTSRSDIMRGIENTSGPLGQGHTLQSVPLLAAKFLKARFNEVMNQTIYAYISDGGIQEEISQGAGRIAGALGLDNLIMFYDSNDIKLYRDERCDQDTAMKYEAWGWNVSIKGNDPDEIRAAIKEAKAEKERPTLIIGKTVMGKGARKADGSSYEANCATHGAPLGGDAYVTTIKNLNGNEHKVSSIFLLHLDEIHDQMSKSFSKKSTLICEHLGTGWKRIRPTLTYRGGKIPLDGRYARKPPQNGEQLGRHYRRQQFRTHEFLRNAGMNPISVET